MTCAHEVDVGAYVIDALEPDERMRVAAHIAGCPSCTAELEALRGLPALLELGTLGGLLLSVTVGFLGFFESWQAPWAHSSVVVEAVGGAVMGGFAVAHAVRSAQESRSRQRRARV